MQDKKLIDNYEQIDPAADWERVKERISFQKPARRLLEPPRRRIRLWEKTAVAVAVCFLIIGGAYLTYFHSEQTTRQEIAFCQLIVPNGQKSQALLPDGTSVWLNSGSRLEFPSTFESDVRLVKLDGEAYFEVTENKQHPFVVQTSGMNIKVYGTTFNVTSYSGEETSEVTLLSGSVGVSDSQTEKEIFLKPSQKIVYEPEKHRFSQPAEAETAVATAWRNDQLIFVNESLGKIFRKLERHYGITIRVEKQAIEQQHYTGSFNRITMEQAIKALQTIEKFSYRMEEEIIYIY